MSTGYIPPRYEDTRAANVATWKLKFGQNADTSSDTVDGEIVDIATLGQQKCFDGLAEVYNQHNLGTATGLNIDALLAPLFGITRLPATPSTCEVWLYGTPSTVVPALSAVSTVDTGASFETTALVTIVAGAYAVFVFPALAVSTLFTITIGAVATNVTSVGDASTVAADVVTALVFNANVADVVQAGLQPDGKAIVFVTMTSTWSFATTYGAAWSATIGFSRATSTGPTVANYGTITRVGAPVTGWEGLTNIVDASLGMREETDGAYKARHARAVNGRGRATPLSVSERMLALEGVGAVKLYQNLSGAVVAGRPSHSFEFVIDGGDPLEIAQEIWLGHTFGTQSYGDVLVTVQDMRGLVVQPADIRFSRPTYRYIHVSVVITKGEGFPALQLTDMQALIGNDLQAWGNTLGIGRDVYIFEINARIGAIVSGIAAIVTNLASTPTPFGSPSFGTSSLTMADLDYSRWAATRVTVAVV